MSFLPVVGAPTAPDEPAAGAGADDAADGPEVAGAAAEPADEVFPADAAVVEAELQAADNSSSAADVATTRRREREGEVVRWIRMLCVDTFHR